MLEKSASRLKRRNLTTARPGSGESTWPGLWSSLRADWRRRSRRLVFRLEQPQRPPDPRPTRLAGAERRAVDAPRSSRFADRSREVPRSGTKWLAAQRWPGFANAHAQRLTRVTGLAPEPRRCRVTALRRPAMRSHGAAEAGQLKLTSRRFSNPEIEASATLQKRRRDQPPSLGSIVPPG